MSPKIALYCPNPSLRKYTLGFFLNNFSKTFPKKVNGAIEIIKYLVFFSFELLKILNKKLIILE